MTREEAIAYGNDYYIDLISACCKIDEKAKEFVRMSLEALEQEPVLDKIRAEIKEYKSRQLTLAIDVDDLEKGKQIAIEYVLAIIDRYKAESEE